MGYSVVSLWPRDMDGLVKDFLLLRRAAWAGAKSAELIHDISARFQAIATKEKNKPKKRAYLQMWTEPLITVGKASFTDWLVSAAGGVNIFGDMPFDSGQIGLESLIQRNPEVLIFLAEQAPFVKTLARRPGWSSIRGVRAGHFCFIEEPDIRRSIYVHRGSGKTSQLPVSQTSSKHSTIINGAQVNRTVLALLWLSPHALLAVILIGLSIGPVRISLFEHVRHDKEIMFSLRLPRVLSAFLVGGGLALAGAIFQGLFRNPIADSYLLGVSSGASLGAAAAIVLKLASPLANFAAVSCLRFCRIAWRPRSGILFRPSQWRILNLPPAAFGFGRRPVSFIASGHLHAHGRRRTQSADFFLSRRLFQFELGYHLGFPRVHTPRRVWPPVISLRNLNVLLLGEETAQSSGVRTGRIQLLFAILAALLTSISVSVAGLIGFVGLIVPHMIRLSFGADHRTLLPLTFFSGGIFLVLCDAAARTIIAPAELPVGIVTSLVGVPVFLYMIRKETGDLG